MIKRGEASDIVSPCEDEILEILKAGNTTPQHCEYSPNQTLAVVWDDADGRNWYIGLYLGQNEEGELRIEHLTRVDGKDSVWQSPRTSDIQPRTLPQQVFPVSIVAEWDFSGRKPCYIVDNSEEIDQVFSDIR